MSTFIEGISPSIETEATGVKKTVSNLIKTVKEGLIDVLLDYTGDVIQPLAKSGNSLNNLFDRDMYAEDGLKIIPKNILSAISETATSVKNIVTGVPLAVGKMYKNGFQNGVKTITNATTEHIPGIRKINHIINGLFMAPSVSQYLLNGLSRGLHIPFDKINNLSSTKASDYKLAA